MTGIIFRRLVWKEYRLQRAFWLALAFAAVLFEAIALWTAPADDRGQALLLVAAMFTAFYALGCGATAFAGEREAGTFDYQRGLPVTASQLFMAKAAFAVGSTLLLGLVSAGVALLMARTVYPALQIDGRILINWPLKSAELLVWGWCFSLLSARPLRAAVVAGLTSTLFSNLGQSITGSTHAYTGKQGWGLLDVFFAATPIWATLTMICLVLCVDIFLAVRWLREPASNASDGTAKPVDRPSGILLGLDGCSVWQRLLWQQWRASSSFLWKTLAISPFVMAFLLWQVGALNGANGATGFSFVLMVIVGGLVGVFTFQGDQWRQSFRFFTERGVSPWRVWRARLAGSGMLWLLTTVGMLGVVAFCLVVADWRGGTSQLNTLNSVLVAVGLAFVAFAVGQLCSLWFRSGILALAMTIFLTLLIFAWTGIMIACEISWIWSVAPIPLVLIFASWSTVGDWLLERRDLRSRTRKFLLLAVPVLVVGSAVVYVRWTEIPGDAPVFATRPSPTPSEIAAARQMKKAYADVAQLLYRDRTPLAGFVAGDRTLVDPDEILGESLSEEQIQWVDGHTELIRLAEKAIGRGDYLEMTYQMNSVDSEFGYLGIVQDALILAARRAELAGRLDEALDWYLAALESTRHDQQLATLAFYRYGYAVQPRANSISILYRLRHWAGLPGQTTERIMRAMRELDGIVARMPTGTLDIEAAYRWNIRCLAGDRDAMERRSSLRPREQRIFQAFLTAFPWERERARRLISALARRNLDQLEWLECHIRENQPLKDLSVVEERFSLPRHWTETTVVWQLLLVRDSGWRVRRLGRLLKNYTNWRATKTVLALQAWRLAHGHWPASLKDLVPELVDQVPVNPMTARPFEYYPSGIATEVAWHETGLSRYCRVRVPPGRPFLSDRRLSKGVNQPNNTRIYPLSVSE